MGFATKRFSKPDAIPSIYHMNTTTSLQKRLHRLEMRNKQKVLAELLQEHDSYCPLRNVTERVDVTGNQMEICSEIKTEPCLVIEAADEAVSCLHEAHDFGEIITEDR